jgi:hypothetical protein
MLTDERYKQLTGRRISRDGRESRRLSRPEVGLIRGLCGAKRQAASGYYPPPRFAGAKRPRQLDRLCPFVLCCAATSGATP